jgi:hypothetical protein
MACYALIASAFVLGTLVVSAAGQRFDQGPAIFESEALGGMVINKNLTTILTAKGAGTDGLVYVLDNKNERLLCYAPSQTGKDTLDLFATMDVGGRMRQLSEAFGGGDGGGGRRGR